MSREENFDGVNDTTASKEGELTLTLFFATLISTLGSSLQYGYNLTVINYPAEFLKSFYNETYRERNSINIDQSILMFLWGLTVSFFQVGAICGSLLVGPLADACGRKGTLLAMNALVIVSAILLGSSRAVRSYELIIVGRLVIGGCVGVFYSVVPMYITELAPPNRRDSLGMVPHLFIVFGELLANLFGLQHMLGSEESWPLLLSLIAFPAIFQMVLLPFFPESPRYLLIQKRNETEARQALRKLRGWDDVEDEIEELYLEDSTEKAEKNMDVLKILRFEDLQWQLTAIIVLMGGQQLSGINAARHYTEEIHWSLGLEDEHILYANLLLNTLLMIMIIIALCIAETLGLRCLLLTGFGICSLSCILLAMSIELQRNIIWMPRITSTLLTVFLIGQSIGPDPVVNVFVSELFLQSSRSTAFVITGTLHWLCKFLFTVTYLHMETELEPYSFVIFWPFGVASFIYLYKILPKIKSKTFLDVRRAIAIHVARRILIQSLPVPSA